MKAYERLIRYAKVYTTSDPTSGTHPSSARQFDLARLLQQEMLQMGIADARVDDMCYLYGTIPATPGCEDKPAIGLIAHMDTAPDACGENVQPQIHENYNGGDIVLKGRTISPEVYPYLKKMVGDTIITSDGTTLLGADDKAGIAEILTACEILLAGDMPHGKVCIAFTPDEEIGEGADHFDIPGFGADFAYTMDGGEAGGIEYENFNAAAATVTVAGVNSHPGSAKNVMVNAAMVAMEFDSCLPRFERPEYTDGYEGFYHLAHSKGEVGQAKLSYILRDHDAVKLENRKAVMRKAAEELNARYGKDTVKVEIRDNYRNMAETIKPHFHLIETARRAAAAAGLEVQELPIRGGTDGARLSWDGLPCPNLGTGGYNYHGEYELCNVQQMDKAVQMILNILAEYAKGL